MDKLHPVWYVLAIPLHRIPMRVFTPTVVAEQAKPRGLLDWPVVNPAPASLINQCPKAVGFGGRDGRIDRANVVEPRVVVKRRIFFHRAIVVRGRALHELDFVIHSYS